jgi:acyl-CoA synthetase (AMP-forming)/AMP-acid ligase II
MNIGESLPRNAQHFPDKPAIVDAHRTVTYREFDERTNRLANYLLSQGVIKGDLVGLSVGSRTEHFEALFALAKIGAIAVPFDFNWSGQECAAMVRFFAPKAFFLEIRKETEALTTIACEHIEPSRLIVVANNSGYDRISLEEAVNQGKSGDPEVRVQSLDPLLLMITSGTTGFPKACSINHETYSLRCMNYGMTKGMNRDERALMALPVHFNAGRGSVMSILILAGRSIFMKSSTRNGSYKPSSTKRSPTRCSCRPCASACCATNG